MSTLNCSVTPGATLVPDAQNRHPLTAPSLNALGLPTVQVALDDGIAAEDIQDDAVEADHLEDALADAILTATATVGTENANDINVTVQVKDAQGNNLAERVCFPYWLSDAAYGATTGTIPSGGVAATTGVAVTALANSTVSWTCTDANGAAVLKFTEAGALTRYFNMMLGGKLLVGSQSLVWT